MNEELLNEQLLCEHDLRHRAEVAGLNRKKAQLALADAENSVSGLRKLLPFLAKSEKEAIQSAASRVEHWEQKERDYQAQHAEAEKQLDVTSLAWIREKGTEAYTKGERIKGFYSLARERVDVFRIRIRDFLEALGQARGAMSTGYNNTNEDYSENAKERLEIALKIAHKLDIALSDVELLNAEFKAKAEGTPFSEIKMPSLSNANYESGIRRASTLPIAQAQIEFEQTLNDCEQLHDQGIGDVIDEIDSLEHAHENLMLEIVRKQWRDLQAKLIRDSSRMQEIRSKMQE